MTHSTRGLSGNSDYDQIGAFKTKEHSDGAIQTTSYPGFTVYLDASKSNPIYGKSVTVQPIALSLRPIIKYT